MESTSARSDQRAARSARSAIVPSRMGGMQIGRLQDLTPAETPGKNGDRSPNVGSSVVEWVD